MPRDVRGVLRRLAALGFCVTFVSFIVWLPTQPRCNPTIKFHEPESTIFGIAYGVVMIVNWAWAIRVLLSGRNDGTD